MKKTLTLLVVAVFFLSFSVSAANTATGLASMPPKGAVESAEEFMKTLQHSSAERLAGYGLDANSVENLKLGPGYQVHTIDNSALLKNPNWTDLEEITSPQDAWLFWLEDGDGTLTFIMIIERDSQYLVGRFGGDATNFKFAHNSHVAPDDSVQLILLGTHHFAFNKSGEIIEILPPDMPIQYRIVSPGELISQFQGRQTDSAYMMQGASYPNDSSGIPRQWLVPLALIPLLISVVILKRKITFKRQ